MGDTSNTSLAAAKAAIEQVLRETTEIKIIAATLLSFVILSVSVRMYVRIKMLRQFGPEDWSMVVAFLLSAGQCSVAITVVEFGQQAVRGQPRPVALNDTIAKWSTGLFSLALVALKISLGFFFLHIFSHKPLHRTFIIALVLLSTITGLAYFALTCFTCTVLLKPPGRDLYCAIQPVGDGVFYAFSVVAIASDFLFCLMAIFALWKAKLPTTTKALACCLLVLGAVGGVASTIRFALLVRPVTVRNYRQSVYDVGKWTIVEHAVGIIAANLAMTRPLVHACFKRVKRGASLVTGERSRGTDVGKVSKMGTAGGGVLGGRQGLGTGDQRTVENNGEAYLLHEIKKEVAVVVDEEKGSQKGSQTSRELEFEREYVYGRARGL